MRIKSTYSDHNFELLVVGETENTYICKHLPQDAHKFQNGDKEFELRKCLIGQLYEIIEEKEEQLSIFDLGVEL